MRRRRRRNERRAGGRAAVQLLCVRTTGARVQSRPLATVLCRHGFDKRENWRRCDHLRALLSFVRALSALACRARPQLLAARFRLVGAQNIESKLPIGTNGGRERAQICLPLSVLWRAHLFTTNQAKHTNTLTRSPASLPTGIRRNLGGGGGGQSSRAQLSLRARVIIGPRRSGPGLARSAWGMINHCALMMRAK